MSPVRVYVTSLIKGGKLYKSTLDVRPTSDR